jgi:hypothetical protein
MVKCLICTLILLAAFHLETCLLTVPRASVNVVHMSWGQLFLLTCVPFRDVQGNHSSDSWVYKDQYSKSPKVIWPLVSIIDLALIFTDDVRFHIWEPHSFRATINSISNSKAELSRFTRTSNIFYISQ